MSGFKDRLALIWTLMEGQRARYVAAMVAMLLSACFLFLAPLVPQIVIDGVLVPADGRGDTLAAGAVEWIGGRALIADNLWWPALIIVVLTAAAGLFTYLRGRWSARASEEIARTVRNRAYDHLQRLPCRYLDRAQTGDLIQRCTSDVETLRTFLSTQVVEIARALIMLVIPIPLMLAIDVRMTLVSLALVPVIVGFSLAYFPRVRAVFRATDEAEGRLTTVIQENLTGARVVRAFARQDFENEKLDAVNAEHRRCDYRLYVLLARFWSISDFLCFSQKALVIGAGAWWLAAGTLPVGAFYYFLTAVNLFIWPVRMMGRILSDLGKAVVAFDRLREILDEPLEDAGEVGRVEAPTIGGAVAFEGVSFAHDGGTPVLRDVSFDVAAGETLAILGPSGCGKSTIVSLLLRFYDYEEGSIRLDGRELRTLDRRAVRRQMAVVMQEPFLYSRSVGDNIRIGRLAASDEAMVEAASLACVHESILGFEEGYATVVGERGVTLSGGQRQRVAIARALLQEPAILVLDDALSAVDTATEAMIIDALRARLGRQTTILIAHRLSTVLHADRILVLDEGRIVQSGTHAQLVEEPGTYRRLWALQSGGMDGAGLEPLSKEGRR